MFLQLFQPLIFFKSWMIGLNDDSYMNWEYKIKIQTQDILMFH